MLKSKISSKIASLVKRCIMSRSICFLLLIVYFWLSNFKSTFGRPASDLQRTTVSKSLEVPPPKVVEFLRRFGYLEANPSESESLYHETAITAAIRNVQKYGALNQTGILDNATLKLFTTPRCGVPDVEGLSFWTSNRLKRYIVGAPSWRKRKIQFFIANWSMKIPRENIERDLEKAFKLWSRYSRLKFERVNETSADIIVGFGTQYHGDNYPFDGPGNILAHAYYPYEMGSWGGDVHFDEDENWKENSTDLADGVDFYSVAVHELGHSLGLAHSPIYSSIMFPYYKGPAYTTLDYDDTLAMYDLYISKILDDDDAKEDIENTEMSHDITTNDTPRITDLESTSIGPIFEGDFETVTQHRQRYKFVTQSGTFTEIPTYSTSSKSIWPTTTSNPGLSDIPDICRGSFDAVTVINGSVHIFKNEYVWKLTSKYTIMNGYPRTLYELFPFFSPKQVRKVDAVYLRYDGSVIFFTGKLFWVLNGKNLIEESPKTLSKLFGPYVNISKIDAAMLWPKNNFTYLFVDAKFWRFDDRTTIMDPDYPKSMRRWKGIPNGIDAAATLLNGKTYFFKGNFYWLYNNRYVRPERGYPRRASTAWLGCPKQPKTPLRNANTTISFISS